MDRYIKILAAAAALFTIIFWGGFSVWAQPLGLMSPQSQQKSELQILCSNNGRYVFGQISDSDKDKFMLDTYTGRLWRIAESGGIGIFLRPVPYQIGEGKYAPAPEDLTGGKNKPIESK